MNKVFLVQDYDGGVLAVFAEEDSAKDFIAHAKHLNGRAANDLTLSVAQVLYGQHLFSQVEYAARAIKNG
jgi:hypothetical protein